MENLLLNQNCYCKAPKINFKSSGELSITGRSISDSVAEYYKPAMDWICGLMDSPPERIELTIQLDYFNSKSRKILLHILKLLEQIHIKGKSEVMVKWLYDFDDKDMYEAGTDYQSIVNIPFYFTCMAEC